MSHGLLILLNRLEKVNQIRCRTLGLDFGCFGRLCREIRRICCRLTLGGLGAVDRERLADCSIGSFALFGLLLSNVLPSIDLEIWVIRIVLEGSGQTGWSMLDLRDFQPCCHFILPRNAEILDYLISLFAKLFVNGQSSVCIVFGHFKKVL